MSKKTQLTASFLAIASMAISSIAHAASSSINTVERVVPHASQELNEVSGDYEGEIRLQSTDGNVNKMVQPRVHLNLQVTGEEVILRTNSNLSNNRCQEQISSIRELNTFPPGQRQVLKAEFDVLSSHCPKPVKPQTVVVLISKDETGGLTLETLLLGASEKEDQELNRGLRVHGYFTHVDSAIAPSASLSKS